MPLLVPTTLSVSARISCSKPGSQAGGWCGAASAWCTCAGAVLVRALLRSWRCWPSLLTPNAANLQIPHLAEICTLHHLQGSCARINTGTQHPTNNWQSAVAPTLRSAVRGSTHLADAVEIVKALALGVQELPPLCVLPRRGLRLDQLQDEGAAGDDV